MNATGGASADPTARPELAVDLGRGLILANPVGLASGTAGFGFELRRLLDMDRIGALFSKGTGIHPRTGNAPPRLAETTAGLLNTIGLPNPGAEHVATVYAPEYSQWRIPVIINVIGATVEDYVSCVRRLDGVDGVAGFELNISCPNVGHGLDFGRDPSAAAGLVAAVRGATEMCVIVKLTPAASDIGAVARAAEDAGADAISAVNTFVGMKVNLDKRRPVLQAAGTGGLSGPAIKPLALAAVAAVRGQVAIPVIGIGGITTTTDALEFFVAGANAVQVGTATFSEPHAAITIIDGIARYLQREGVTRVTDLRWSGFAAGSVPPAGIEPASTG